MHQFSLEASTEVTKLTGLLAEVDAAYDGLLVYLCAGGGPGGKKKIEMGELFTTLAEFTGFISEAVPKIRPAKKAKQLWRGGVKAALERGVSADKMGDGPQSPGAAHDPMMSRMKNMQNIRRGSVMPGAEARRGGGAKPVADQPARRGSVMPGAETARRSGVEGETAGGQSQAAPGEQKSAQDKKLDEQLQKRLEARFQKAKSAAEKGKSGKR